MPCVVISHPFTVGAVLVDDGTVEYEDFFTAMFAVIFGAWGVGQVFMFSGVIFVCDTLYYSIYWRSSRRG